MKTISCSVPSRLLKHPGCSVQVNLQVLANPDRVQRVVPDMEPIHELHLAEPGLIVVDVAAADDHTAFAFQQALAARWATATADRTTRDPGQPGVRLRCYVVLRQDSAPGARPAAGDPSNC